MSRDVVVHRSPDGICVGRDRALADVARVAAGKPARRSQIPDAEVRVRQAQVADNVRGPGIDVATPAEQQAEAEWLKRTEDRLLAARELAALGVMGGLQVTLTRIR